MNARLWPRAIRTSAGSLAGGGLLLWPLLAIGSAEADGPPFMSASFYDMSDAQFSITAVSPPDLIEGYIICKAVWFAEKQGVQTISFGNPIYGETPTENEGGPVPNDWLLVSTTAYLGETHNPLGHPKLSVSELADSCHGWDWYQ